MAAKNEWLRAKVTGKMAHASIYASRYMATNCWSDWIPSTVRLM